MELQHPRPTVKTPASAFTGDVYMTPIYQGQGPSRMTAALVRFTPGARTNWHSHAVGQRLHVSEGVGLVGTRDGSVVRARAGDTVVCPPGEEHWHGATADTFMSHFALLEAGLDGSDPTTWLEPVTDGQYAAAHDHHKDPMPDQPQQIGGGRRTIGDIAPKLAEITDDVLFADVWNRTELAARDRSLITVAALVAAGDADQLRFHLGRARENGVAEAELIEVITHLAFYAGWPKAMTAMGVARQVFGG